MKSQIYKLYMSNFLTGLVFWYGIEKLFMRHIGIDAVGIGIATAVFIIFNLFFDIPAGILADKWSRKGVLVISAAALGVCSFLLGSSHDLLLYAIGEIFYGLYVVATSGTYAAMTYDVLHEENRADEYSKIAGRAYALFLIGAGIANIASGFIAHHFGYRSAYFVTIISCAVNVFVILAIREPKFHKPELKEKTLASLAEASIALGKLKILRVLTVVVTLLTIADLFESEFGQLYMLRYFSAPQIIGILWAVYAFAWAFGSAIAHRFRTRLHALVVCSTLPLVAMAFIDNRFSIALLMLQVVASTILLNQVETRIQENAPSHVRASILSVVATFGRIVSVPAAFILGWLFRDYNALVALRFVAATAGATFLYWLWARRTTPDARLAAQDGEALASARDIGPSHA